MFQLLLTAKSLGWIGGRCPVRRQHAPDAGRRNRDQRSTDRGVRVIGSHGHQHTSHCAAEPERAKEPERASTRCQPHSFAQDVSPKPAGARTKRGPDAELATAKRHHQREGRAQADRREDCSEPAERGQYPHRKTPWRALSGHDLAHCRRAAHVDVGIQLPSRRAYGGSQLHRIPGSSNEDVLDAERGLPGRQIDIKPRIGQSSIADVLDDTDHRLPAWLLTRAGLTLRWHDEDLADRILAGPVTGRRGFAHDQHLRGP